MLRLSFCLALVACTNPSKADVTAPTPVNLVCERLALVDKDATCTAELTDVGDRHTHRARIAQGSGAPVVCTVTDANVTAVCGPLFPVPKQEEPAAEPPVAKVPPPKQEPKKGGK
jgi:hypothetical protein